MLEIKGISKIFGHGTINEKIAINNLNLHMGKGDFITVIGSNGAGKSTLLNCIAGAFPIDEGEIVLAGKDVTKLKEYKRAKHIGRVFQDPLKGTAFDMSIEENMSIAFNKNKTRGLQPGITAKDRGYFKERLELLHMGLENRMKEKVKLLSGGQRQALTLLMATLTEPKLLLLDEHTAALDPGAAEKVLTLTDMFSVQTELCILMITHNMKSALAHGNRTIVMNEGKIKLDIKGEERKALTIERLISQFDIDNDRMILG